jgi:hypothetical protein
VWQAVLKKGEGQYCVLREKAVHHKELTIFPSFEVTENNVRLCINTGKFTEYTSERMELMTIKLRLKEIKAISLFTGLLDNDFYYVLLIFQEKERLGIWGGGGIFLFSWQRLPEQFPPDRSSA